MKSKKILTVLCSAILLFNTVGCTSIQAKNTNTKTMTTQNIAKANNNLSEKQVIANFQKSLKNTKSISANYKINVREIDKDNKEVKGGTSAKYDITSKIIYAGVDKDNAPAIKEMYTKLSQVVDGKTEKSISYVNLATKKAYLDQDGKGLKEFKGTQLQTQTESQYVNVGKQFLLTKLSEYFLKNPDKQLKMTESKETYDFTFSGKNGELLYALDGLFGLGIDAMNLDKVDIDLTYKISKKDFTIKKVIHVLKQTSDGKMYKSMGEYTVTGANELKAIDEAKNIK